MTGDDQPTLAQPVGQPPSQESGRWAWIVLGVVAVMLLVGGGALLAYVLLDSSSEPEMTASRNESNRRGDNVASDGADDAKSADTAENEDGGKNEVSAKDDAPAGQESADVTLPPATTAAPAPTLPPTTEAPPTTPAPASTVMATVARTCGADDNGDCFVTKRSAPSSSGTDLGQLTDRTMVELVCQQRGEAAYSSVLDARFDVWARSTDGSWLAMAYLDAPGWSLTDVTVPC